MIGFTFHIFLTLLSTSHLLLMDLGSLVENTKQLLTLLRRFSDCELVYHIKERGLVSKNYLTGNETVILPTRILVIFLTSTGPEWDRYIKFIFSPNTTLTVLKSLLTGDMSYWSTAPYRWGRDKVFTASKEGGQLHYANTFITPNFGMGWNEKLRTSKFTEMTSH